MRQRRLAAAVVILLAVSVTGCMEENMSFLSSKIEIAANPNLAEWIPRIAYNAVDDEFLVVWTEQGVRVAGRRIAVWDSSAAVYHEWRENWRDNQSGRGTHKQDYSDTNARIQPVHERVFHWVHHVRGWV